MKRFVLLGLAALSVFAVPAWAGSGVATFRMEVPFILQRAAVPASDHDSLVVSHAGSRTDTSGVFRFDGWAFEGSGNVADSLMLFTVDYSCIPGSTVTPASSTTTMSLQASADGTNWATVGATMAPFNNAPALTAINTGSYVRGVTYDLSLAQRQMLAQQKLRLIVASAASGQFKLIVSYPRAFGSTQSGPRWISNVP